MEYTEPNALRRDMVVVGGSAGAIDALRFIADLPPSFPAAMFVTTHMAPDSPGLLPDIISRYSKLPTKHAQHGESITVGRIYVARPDYHLCVEPGFVQVARGPKENRHRPSIDVLFRSAAKSYGPRVIGVILSGMLDDGSAGLVEIRRRGGLGIVQDPEDALFPDMPRNALAQAGADHCVPKSELVLVLAKALMNNVGDHLRAKDRAMENEADEAYINHNDDGKTSLGLSCPDCGGVLRQIEDKNMLRFRCRVGHTLSGNTLFEAQSETVEQALWTALRLMEEKAEIAHKMKEYALSRNFKSAPQKFEEQANKLERDAKLIRELLNSSKVKERI
jgi:two-component system chemotaxis response regulator CheB